MSQLFNVLLEFQVQSMFKYIKDTFGALHVCVNNAGLAYDAPITSGKTKVSFHGTFFT